MAAIMMRDADTTGTTDTASIAPPAAPGASAAPSVSPAPASATEPGVPAEPDVPALAYQRRGTPSHVPLVLLHALPLDSSMWDNVCTKLEDLDIITPDAPGFGDSRTILTDRTPSLSLYAQAVKALLDHASISKIVLGGLSMGGAVAAEFTARYPSMVAGLALMDTNIGLDTAQGREGRLAKAALADEGKGYATVRDWPHTMLSPHASDQVRQTIAQCLRHLPNEGLAWQQRAMADRHDRTCALELVHGPVFLGCGDADPTCSLEYMMHLALKASQPYIREFSEAGHFSANEQPAQVAQFLRDLYEKATA